MRPRFHLTAAALALVPAFAGMTALGALTACNTHDLLQVTDPDIINPSDVQSAAGAAAVRVGAIGRLTAATSGGSSGSEGLLLLSGLFADEWNNGDSFIARQEVDQRVITISNTFLTDVDRNLQRVVHNFQLLSTALSQRDADLAGFVQSTNAVFAHFAAQPRTWLPLTDRHSDSRTARWTFWTFRYPQDPIHSQMPWPAAGGPM